MSKRTGGGPVFRDQRRRDQASEERALETACSGASPSAAARVHRLPEGDGLLPSPTVAISSYELAFSGMDYSAI